MKSPSFRKLIFIIFFSKSSIATKTLKSGSHLPKKVVLMKIAFYFILKALFVIKIFKFLSWVFGHVEKKAWLER